MTTPQTESIEGFDQCCIIHFTAGFWRGRKKIDKAILERIVKNNPSASKYLTGSKNVVDPAEIKKVAKAVNKAISYLNPDRPESPVLKHPIKGLKTIPFELIQACDDKLNEIKAEATEAWNKFCSKFSELKAAARNDLELDGLYSLLDYPLDIESKFFFEWRFLSMSAPDDLQMISPEIYQREVNKLKETMEAVRQDAVDALRYTFQDMVSNIVERFSDKVDKGQLKSKTFRNSTVNNFYEFFEQFKQRNVFNDAELAKLVDKAQDILKGRDPDKIRENDSMKKLIRKNMLPIEKQIKNLAKRPRRKLKVD